MMTLQANGCIPELYFLKYHAIPTPWECESNPKRFGFKCIKYGSWKNVQANAESAKKLREIGSSLIDEGIFPLHHYGQFSLVWERVRRWAVDKEGFSIEPNLTVEYESASRVMSLGARDGKYVMSFIRDIVQGFTPKSSDDAWSTFKQLLVAKLLGDSKAISALKVSIPIFDDWKDVQTHRQTLSESIVQLYAAVGFEVRFENAGEVIDLLLEELGFAINAPTISIAEQRTARSATEVLVERRDRLDFRLLEAKLAGNSMVLILNGRHPALQEGSPYCSFFADAGQLKAFGRACRDHVGNMEDVQGFLDSWGVHLASVMRASRRTEGR